MDHTVAVSRDRRTSTIRKWSQVSNICGHVDALEPCTAGTAGVTSSTGT